jgi:hypothetical protein
MDNHPVRERKQTEEDLKERLQFEGLGTDLYARFFNLNR